jgi:hypothetical protein
MKIYINHFNLLVLNNTLKTLNDYLNKSEEYIQIYSPDGIFIIDENNTFKLKPVDNDITVLKNFYNEFSLIIDPSFFIVEKVTQMPTEFISTRMKRDIFVSNTNKIKGEIKLVIETEIFSQIENGFSFLNKNPSENDFKPKDIYFELPNGTNIDDILVKEEIIVFLSLLN